MQIKIESSQEQSDDMTKVLLTAYAEISKSYHSIDDYRVKLLGSLPLASLVGIFLLNFEGVPIAQDSMSSELMGFVGLFATALTLFLFGYEIRGIQRCHHLIREGAHLERDLGIGHGQFHVCEMEHESRSGIARSFNSKLIACAIYALVFSGWVFITLRMGFGISTLTCAFTAGLVGLLLAFGMYRLVRTLIAA